MTKVNKGERHKMQSQLLALQLFSSDIGAIAQLGERLLCTQEVRSSILLGSTINSIGFYTRHRRFEAEQSGSEASAVLSCLKTL